MAKSKNTLTNDAFYVLSCLGHLGTFITAFIFSIVLAFDEEAGNRTGSPLTLGLLCCWLPLLVIFTIIDRNPVSADRSVALMSRWLFNVDAVLTSARAAGADLNNMQTPVWWSRNRPAATLEVFEIQEFIGQGRKIKCCGLADAMIRNVRALQQQKRPLGNNLDQYRLCAQTVLEHLDGTRPTQWWVTAVVSFFLVVFEVMMAFLVAYCTPTFGLGCWSGGYMMFESFDYYVKNFAMDGPWISASVLGGLVPGAVLVTTTAWWMKCQHLWSTEEKEPVQDFALGNVNFRADTSWLRA
ncbi:hypothetical protein CEP52_011963 [Fusarium oligoseptatum]|uniref:Uncharacterized protein n=1 Tax=Fusarium oligoseptatum TaxID=2604345 RepID=A0A428T0Z0_9HYPO|nr:hypothetical protein CEP52_011963 [Fusarium oligoseptatum]